MTTECPVCGVHAWVEAPTCPACGTALRALDPDDLFTTVAVDNAEVVAAPPPSHDEPPVEDAVLVEEPAAGPDAEDLWDVAAEDDDLWDTTGPLGAGSQAAAFSAEPSDRSADVIDAEEVLDDDLWDTVGTSEGAPDRPLFVAPAAAQEAARPGPAPAVPSSDEPDLWDDLASTSAPVSEPGPPSSADPHGLTGALARISPEVVDRAAVPLAVVSVLLDDDEVVESAVVGEMLGHPAAVVVTARRAVVANGRRWSPVVDVFEVDASLDVRGRHDGGVAAITLMDRDRIVTVDGIADVALAMHFADRVRARTRR